VALSANTTGDNNIALGSGAGQNLTTGNNNIDIGNDGNVGESRRIRIGTKGDQVATYLQGVYNQTSSGGVPVLINSAGKLGTASAASAATGTKAASADRKLRAKVNRLQRAVRQLRAEVKRGR
jgi:hypothetical protein